MRLVQNDWHAITLFGSCSYHSFMKQLISMEIGKANMKNKTIHNYKSKEEQWFTNYLALIKSFELFSRFHYKQHKGRESKKERQHFPSSKSTVKSQTLSIQSCNQFIRHIKTQLSILHRKEPSLRKKKIVKGTVTIMLQIYSLHFQY